MRDGLVVLPPPPRTTDPRGTVPIILPKALPTLALVLLTSACASPPDASRPGHGSVVGGAPLAAPMTTADSPPTTTEAGGLRVSLLGVSTPNARDIDRGWRSYQLLLENRSTGILRISSVRLQTAAGLLMAPAAAHAELQAPPAAAPSRTQDLGEQVAARAAGIAAGQVIPYGGLLVQALTGVGSAAAAETRDRAERTFRQQRAEGLELAPGGRAKGESWVPAEVAPVALVLVVTEGADWRHLSLPLAPPAPARLHP